MNTDAIIKWTNRIAMFAITLLIYWVFIFISITVFDFKIFRENITQTFEASIFGIIALLSGAIIVNVMFNLTKISESVGQTSSSAPQKKFGKIFIVFFISFPVIFGLLYSGDMRTTIKKESIIRQSAESLVEENQQILEQFCEYSFDNSWIKQTSNNLKFLEKIDESFPSVDLIIQDKIKGKDVFLRFSRGYYDKNAEKVDYIYSCSFKERSYLAGVFAGKLDTEFSSSDGHYELYYPVKIDSKIVVLYLSESQRYGKMGY